MLEKELEILQYSYPIQVVPPSYLSTSNPTLSLLITFINVEKQSRFSALVSLSMGMTQSLESKDETINFYPNCKISVDAASIEYDRSVYFHYLYNSIFIFAFYVY